jgi:AMP-polyphosphate phosphotransferase
VRRFRDRLTDPLKRWKLSYEDFRNRARWSDYQTAIEDMMEETSTKATPWYLIPSNSKPYSRIAALTILADRMGKHVSLEPRPIDPGILREAKKVLHLTPADIRHALEPRKVTSKRTPA